MNSFVQGQSTWKIKYVRFARIQCHGGCDRHLPDIGAFGNNYRNDSSFLVQIYLCNQTVCKYRRHNARWFVVLISVHMLMQVCINVSVAVAISFGFDLMAKTFRQLSPILNPEMALTGELSSVRVLYRVCE